MDTRWRGIDLSFDVSENAVALNSQYRVRPKAGGAWSTWASVADATVTKTTVRGSTGALLDRGAVYDVQVRACGTLPSDEACSPPSAAVAGATRASRPTAATASQIELAPERLSADSLRLEWVIRENHLQNPHAGYDIGYTTNAAAAAPDTMADVADIPSFQDAETEVTGLTPETEYRLFVRSFVAYDGVRHFESPWVSAVAETAADKHNRPPTIAPIDDVTRERVAGELEVVLEAKDPDGDALIYWAESGDPTVVTVAPGAAERAPFVPGGSITVTPQDLGTAVVTVTVEDSSGETADPDLLGDGDRGPAALDPGESAARTCGPCVDGDLGRGGRGRGLPDSLAACRS